MRRNIFLVMISLAMVFAFFPRDAFADQRGEISAVRGNTIGAGDGRIHVIPALSAPSVKNGGKLTIQAVVKAAAGVKKVEAEIEGVEKIALKPAPINSGGLNPAATLGMWQAEWAAHGLQKKIYRVTLRVTDGTGHVFADRSLSFSDPAAGNSTPGSTAYPYSITESFPSCAVIDAAHGYAYFGTDTSPGIVVKMALGSGASPPIRVGAVTLSSGENNLRSAIIDTAQGYAYFGTYTSPGIVVKVALGSGSALPSRVSALSLNTGENGLECAVIDSTQGYAYFGTSTSPGIIVKVGLGSGSAASSRVGALTLNTGENVVSCALIDPAQGFGYFGTTMDEGNVIKVALGSGSTSPSRAGAVYVGGYLTSAVIDTAHGCAYFGTTSTSGVLIKVALGSGASPPSLIGGVYPGNDYDFTSGVVDPANGYAYFCTNDLPGKVVKVALDSGNAVGAATCNTGENYLKNAVIDTANGYAYFGSYTSPGIVVKVALGSGPVPPSRVGAGEFDIHQAEPLRRVGSLTLSQSYLGSAVIDAVQGYAYFGASTNHFSGGAVVKVALGSGATPPSRIGALTLNSGEISVSSAVIDAAHGYAYFGTGTSPGIVVKVALGDGPTTPSRVGALTLNSGESILSCAVIDATQGYAYFGTGTSPGKVVKVALGSGGASPARVGAVTLNNGENNLQGAVIDAAGGYAYYSTGTKPAMVVKVALGSGNAPPSRVAALTLSSGESGRCVAIDPNKGYAYLMDSESYSPGKVIKLALGSGNATPSRVGALTLNDGENELSCAAFDMAQGYAFFATYEQENSPAKVIKVALGSGDDLPSRVGALTLNSGDQYPSYAVIDAAQGYAYFGINNDDNSLDEVIKVALSYKDTVQGNQITMIEPGRVNDLRFFSHTASGNLRLAIYDNASPKNLLWQSGVVTNTVTGNWLTVPISSGVPPSLNLQQGTYWLAWQTDSPADVPSYTPGNYGAGFEMDQTFGTYPTLIADSNIQPTANLWSEYLTYATNPIASMVSLATDPTGAYPIPVTVILSDVSTDFTASDITLTNATVGEFAGSGSAYSFNLYPTGRTAASAAINPGVFTDPYGAPNSASSPLIRTFNGLLPTIWVNFAYGGTQTGSQAQPYKKLVDGLGGLLPAGTIKLQAGSNPDALRIIKAVRVESVGGTANIGR